MKSYRSKQALQHLKGFGFPGKDITQNQLIHWADKGVVIPSIQDAAGYSSYREYSFRDLLKCGLVGRLLAIGIDLRDIKFYFERVFENQGFFARHNVPASNIYEALKIAPESHRYFYEDSIGSIGARTYGFCTNLSELVASYTHQDRELDVTTLRMINIKEILDTLKARTGEEL